MGGSGCGGQCGRPGKMIYVRPGKVARLGGCRQGPEHVLVRFHVPMGVVGGCLGLLPPPPPHPTSHSELTPSTPPWPLLPFGGRG